MLVEKDVKIQLNDSERMRLSALLEFSRLYMAGKKSERRQDWAGNLGITLKELNDTQLFLDDLFGAL